MPLHDALHPLDGPNPPQPQVILGASLDSAPAFPTEGTPPFINRRLSIAEWDRYIAAYPFSWRLPARVTLHHTYKPNETTWAGLASMRAMQRYYAGKGWTSAPHIYTAPDGIWLATPLDRIGIHAGAGNGSVAEGWYSIGLEMVGDFDRKRPAGAVWAYTLAVLRGLQRRAGVPWPTFLDFHRDFSEKTCPGSAVTEAWVLSELRGEAPVPTMTRVIGTRPSVTLAQFRAWLRAVNAPFGEHFDAVTERVYALCGWLDIDPAFVAAIWKHETMQVAGRIGSSDLYGKSFNAGGIKAYSSLDNPRWPLVAHNNRRFNVYESPQLGLFGLVFHLKQIYGARGLLTIEQIIPVWAPGDDENDPASYQADVRRVMAAMRSL